MTTGKAYTFPGEPNTDMLPVQDGATATAAVLRGGGTSTTQLTTATARQPVVILGASTGGTISRVLVGQVRPVGSIPRSRLPLGLVARSTARTFPSALRLADRLQALPMH